MFRLAKKMTVKIFSLFDAISSTFLKAVNMPLLSGRHKMHPVYNGVHSIIRGAVLYRGGKNRCILVSVYVLSRFWFLSVDRLLVSMVQLNSHRRIFVVEGGDTQVHQRVCLLEL